MSRQEFVVGFVETLQKEGFDNNACQAIAASFAAATEGFSADEFSAFMDDVSQGNTKKAMEKLSAGQLSGMLGALKDFGVAGLSAGTHLVGNVGRGLIDASPAAAALGVVGPAALGYGVGHAAAGLFDDPEKVISEAKHREIVARLRANASKLRQNLPADDDEDEQTISGSV